GVGGDQQILAASSSSVLHYDLRQEHLIRGGREGCVIPPAAVWPLSGPLRDLRACSLAHNHGGVREQLEGTGLSCICDGKNGEWISVGSSGGQVVVLDKRLGGGRPLYRWNAHSSVVERVFPISRNLLLTVSRDLTAVVWDLSISMTDPLSGVPVPAGRRLSRVVENGGMGLRDRSFSSAPMPVEVPPARVSTTVGLPHYGHGLSPATVLVTEGSRGCSEDSSNIAIGRGGGWGHREDGQLAATFTSSSPPSSPSPSSASTLPLPSMCSSNPSWPVLLAISGNRVTASPLTFAGVSTAAPGQQVARRPEGGASRVGVGQTREEIVTKLGKPGRFSDHYSGHDKKYASLG
ncbi:unnamed protein product, partial [Discosporangium mesarthrocarpum]